MAAVARPYGLAHARARPTTWRPHMEETVQCSSTAMAEPISADVLAAIAHPLRLAILVALEARELTVAELAIAVRATEPEVEQAVAVLHDAGLVRDAAARGRLRAASPGWVAIAQQLRRLADDSRG
jgi:DNA-binding transcriptional ArsR family regulator